MKLLVSLSSYGDKNLQYLNHVIDVYKSYKKYDVTIDVHCTVKLDRDDINQIVHDNPATTCLFHRQDFIREQNNFDLFLQSNYCTRLKLELVSSSFYTKSQSVAWGIDYCTLDRILLDVSAKCTSSLLRLTIQVFCFN